MIRLALIGMSRSGKSHWSKKLEENGFRRFCCDELISQRLAPELETPGATVNELGAWMGFPFDSGYLEREARYLALEIAVLDELLDSLEFTASSTEANIVIDTTGSVIYTGETRLGRLKRLTTVVHLQTPPEVRETMLQSYLAKPRPVLWQGVFVQKPGETQAEALARCYADLLSSRERLYDLHAHVTLDYGTRRRDGFTVDDFLRETRIGAHDRP